MHFATAVIVPAELKGRELEDHLYRELAVFNEGDWSEQVSALLAPKAAEFPAKARAMLAARKGDKVVMVDFHR